MKPVVISDTEDMRLIVEALSAYQHNDQYRTLYRRLIADCGCCVAGHPRGGRDGQG